MQAVFNSLLLMQAVIGVFLYLTSTSQVIIEFSPYHVIIFFLSLVNNKCTLYRVRITNTIQFCLFNQIYSRQATLTVVFIGWSLFSKAAGNLVTECVAGMLQ